MKCIVGRLKYWTIKSLTLILCVYSKLFVPSIIIVHHLAFGLCCTRCLWPDNRVQVNTFVSKFSNSSLTYSGCIGLWITTTIGKLKYPTWLVNLKFHFVVIYWKCIYWIFANTKTLSFTKNSNFRLKETELHKKFAKPYYMQGGIFTQWKAVTEKDNEQPTINCRHTRGKQAAIHQLRILLIDMSSPRLCQFA